MIDVLSSLLWWGVVLIVSVFVVLLSINSNTKNFSDNELIKSQIVKDEFDDHSLLGWIKETRPATEIKILVVKPTDFWVHSLGLSKTENFDMKKNLIGCIIDYKTDEILAMKLFKFRSMSKRMLAKFGTGNEIMLSA